MIMTREKAWAGKDNINTRSNMKRGIEELAEFELGLLGG
jgi:hypothetical protein